MKTPTIPPASGRALNGRPEHEWRTQLQVAGAPRVDLLSNTVLGPAIALYRALGFVEVPLPASEYARANIKMVLDLTATPAS